jgi:hypothetical protein
MSEMKISFSYFIENNVRQFGGWQAGTTNGDIITVLFVNRKLEKP